MFILSFTFGRYEDRTTINLVVSKSKEKLESFQKEHEQHVNSLIEYKTKLFNLQSEFENIQPRPVRLALEAKNKFPSDQRLITKEMRDARNAINSRNEEKHRQFDFFLNAWVANRTKYVEDEISKLYDDKSRVEMTEFEKQFEGDFSYSIYDRGFYHINKITVI